MSIIREGAHTAEFIISEGQGQISREKITIAAGAALAAGTVLGIVTASGRYAPYVNSASNGTEVAVGILYGNVQASATDPRDGVAIVRLAEVAKSMLTGLDAPGTVDLAARFIIPR